MPLTATSRSDRDTLQQAASTLVAMSLFAYILWWAWIAIPALILFAIMA